MPHCPRHPQLQAAADAAWADYLAAWRLADAWQEEQAAQLVYRHDHDPGFGDDDLVDAVLANARTATARIEPARHAYLVAAHTHLAACMPHLPPSGQ